MLIGKEKIYWGKEPGSVENSVKMKKSSHLKFELVPLCNNLLQSKCREFFRKANI